MVSARHVAFDGLLPFSSDSLPVDECHTLYFEQCGNPHGKPVVVLHGGPGSGINPMLRRLHDPKAYRIILFDQRGCGRSTPYGSLEKNTTWHLVADIEALRVHLGIARWQVFGGSWGSTLALAYAEAHPDRVTELVLRSIFTLRKSEIGWFYHFGASEIFPDAFEALVAPIPEDERHDLIAAYYRRLTDPDEAVQRTAARTWAQWEGRTLSLIENPARAESYGTDKNARAFARIECHYFLHGGFLRTETQLLDDADRIRHIPTTIVHGRYDVVTPLRNAWDLAGALPNATLDIIPDAGHAVSEPGIVDRLVRATERFKKR